MNTQVLNGLQTRQVLAPDTVRELEDCIRERDTAAAHPALSPDGDNKDVPRKAHSPSRSKSNGIGRPDKRQIEQRIEEDRERHKRLRESIWAVPPEGDTEFERLWDDASDIGEDDFIAAEEDAQERRLASYELE